MPCDAPSYVVRDEADLTRTVTSTERVWAGPICAVDDEWLELAPGAEPIRRQTVAHHDAVAIVALREGADSSQPDGAAEIMMVRQYRHPVRAMLWEIPAGLLDEPGEEPVRAAQRELAEETDLRAESWEVLAEYMASPGFTTEGVRIFLARGVSALPAQARQERVAEEAEFVPTWVRLEEATAAVMEGRLHNPGTVIGVLAAARAQAQGWAGLRPAEAPWLRSPRSL